MLFTAKSVAVLTVAAFAFSLVSDAAAEPKRQVRRLQVPTELKQWAYPGASCFASMTNAPMVMAQFTTSAPVRKVAGFYRKKVSQGKYYQGALDQNEVAWSDHSNGGGGINAMAGGSRSIEQPTVSNYLYFVRKNRQVITIQVRYVEAEKLTQITLLSARR